MKGQKKKGEGEEVERKLGRKEERKKAKNEGEREGGGKKKEGKKGNCLQVRTNFTNISTIYSSTPNYM